MKKVQPCQVTNCIPTPSTCVTWEGGEIEYLGICNGDSLNTLVWEVVAKLQALAGEDLSSFDIESLLDICNEKAPTDVTLLSILTVIKNNQVCLKDFLDGINAKLNELFQNTGVNINLKCYTNFDNLGNALAITRDTLDQLVIDNLCSHENRIDGLEGKVVSLQSQIDVLSTAAQDSSTDDVSTCVDGATKPVSSQIVSVSVELCNLQDATGDPTFISSALGKTPSDLNTEFGLISGWALTPANWAEHYGNMILEIEDLRQRIKFMENNCCAVNCDDIKLGFSAVYNEDGSGIIIKFTSGAGTSIPNGFTDKGSTGTITDAEGNVETFTLSIANNLEIEIPVSGLDTTKDLDINITAKVGSTSLTCEKCLYRVVKNTGCQYCEITATGDSGATAVIVYEDGNIVGSVITTPASLTTTTTTSSTTTTTTSA